MFVPFGLPISGSSMTVTQVPRLGRDLDRGAGDRLVHLFEHVDDVRSDTALCGAEFRRRAAATERLLLPCITGDQIGAPGFEPDATGPSACRPYSCISATGRSLSTFSSTRVRAMRPTRSV